MTVVKSSSGHLYVLGEIGGIHSMSLVSIPIRKLESLAHFFIYDFMCNDRALCVLTDSSQLFSVDKDLNSLPLSN